VNISIPGRRLARLLVAVGLAWLLTAVAPSGSADEDDVPRLIRQLGSPRFKDRERASKRLAAIGAPAWYRLRKAAATSTDLEVRIRAGKLVRDIGKKLFVEVRHITGGRPGYWLNRVAFTPDGKRAVATGGGVIVYDLRTGKELRRTLELQFARPGLALSRDGKYFLTGHQNDRILRMGEVDSGKEVRTFQGHRAGINGVALSPDGDRAASASNDSTVRLWDVKTGRQLQLFRGPGSQASCVVFSPDGRQLLSGHFGPGSGNRIVLWDAASGREVRRFTGHSGVVTAVVFLPDGRSFLSASGDGTVRQWDVKTGKERRRMEHKGGVNDVAISPDGRRALSAGFGDHKVRIWNLSDGELLYSLEGHRGAVLGVAFSPDGRQALSCDSEYTIRLWRLPGPEVGP
jgi:WD40 repeat protein